MCELRDTFLKAVAVSESIPETARTQAGAASDVEAHSFDRSYLEFLDEQIRLGVRGPAWIQRLKRRRERLTPFCGRTLLRGRIDVGTQMFTVEVDPDTATVVYWEGYEDRSDST